MTTFIRGLLLAVATALALGAMSGCHKNKHREVRVHEETREGPVVEEKTEMVVE